MQAVDLPRSQLEGLWLAIDELEGEFRESVVEVDGKSSYQIDAVEDFAQLPGTSITRAEFSKSVRLDSNELGVARSTSLVSVEFEPGSVRLYVSEGSPDRLLVLQSTLASRLRPYHVDSTRLKLIRFLWAAMFWIAAIVLYVVSFTAIEDVGTSFLVTIAASLLLGSSGIPVMIIERRIRARERRPVMLSESSDTVPLYREPMVVGIASAIVGAIAGYLLNEAVGSFADEHGNTPVSLQSDAVPVGSASDDESEASLSVGRED